jgi:hypothetical protein
VAIEGTIQATQHIPEELAAKGKIDLSKQAISKYIGELYIQAREPNLATCSGRNLRCYGVEIGRQFDRGSTGFARLAMGELGCLQMSEGVAVSCGCAAALFD